MAFCHASKQPTKYVNCISYTPSPLVDSLLLMTSFSDILVPQWFAETYVKGYTQRKYCLVKAITLLERNTVKGVK